MDWIYGKTVLITGASSGIGRALTIKLIKERNCKVIGIGQSEPKMMGIKEELENMTDAFQYKIFDVSNIENWRQLARQLEMEKTCVDILINNAGILLPFDESINYQEEQVQRCMNINFHGCRYAINTMLPVLKYSTMPAIINISSSDALVSIIGTSIYSASKAALKAYTEALIGEFGDEIYIGYVCPGFVQTNIFRNQYVISDNKLIQMLSASPDRIASKIVKKMKRRKARMIIGKDARFMNFTSKFFPIAGLKFYAWIIKHSNIKMFEKIR